MDMDIWIWREKNSLFWVEFNRQFCTARIYIVVPSSVEVEPDVEKDYHAVLSAEVTLVSAFPHCTVLLATGSSSFILFHHIQLHNVVINFQRCAVAEDMTTALLDQTKCKTDSGVLE